MEIATNYNGSQYNSFNNLAKFHDYKMAALYNDQETSMLYYEYTQNQLKLKNLANSELSLNGNSVHSPTPSSAASMQPRLHAYDYQLYPNQNCFPPEEHFYDSVRREYPNAYNDWHPDYGYETVSVCSRSKKKKHDKGTTKSRSKSSDRTLRKLPDSENSNFWEGTAQVVDAYGAICTIPMNRSLSGNVYRAPHNNSYRDELESYPQEPYNGFPSKMAHRTDFNHGRWQQWPFAPRGNCCSMPLPLSPSSPLDSGLSSQSIASSPSLEAEPIQMQRLPECGSPAQLTAFQNSQCSCSSTSFSDPNFLSPPIKSDSGRSSPWTQSAMSRLNALTKAKKHNVPCEANAPVFVDVSPHDDFHNKRFSMSGIYISPKDKSYFQNATKVIEMERENSKTPRKKFHGSEKSSNFYKHVEREKPAHVYTSRIEAKTLHSHRRENKQDDNSEIKRVHSSNSNKDHNSHDCEKFEEPISTPTSSNSTDSSTQTSNKIEYESSKLNKTSSRQSEKAICELEEMYNKLNLQDYDLLDRAERRDLPTVHQDPRILNGVNFPSLTRSKSDSFFEILGPNLCNPFKKLPRAPPLRRSGIPDRIADDMAIRKLQKPPKSFQPNENSATYMLYSSHFTPSVSVPNDVLMPDRPDIEYDDLSYRRYYQMSSGKILDPQPPFGIPLNPLPPQSIFSDYLHVVPSGVPPPICHPRGNPDLVRDDLAYRALRKDDPERAMYDSYSLFYRKMR